MFPTAIPFRSRPWRLAWFLSVGLHVTVTGIALSWMLSTPLPVGPSSSEIQVDGRWGPASVDSPSTFVDATTVDVTKLDAGEVDERWVDVVDASQTRNVLPDPKVSDLSSFVQRQIDRSVTDGQHRSQQENENKLARLSRRLNETSKPKHIDEMADFLGGLLGQRRTEPDSKDLNPNDNPSPFDIDTAQFHRVRKEMDAAGKTQYIATMIDAHGITTEIALDAETGPQLYKIMKIIESNPLLERVYRKIVMGFLDQALSKKTSE
jgi:hypothetical protein